MRKINVAGLSLIQKFEGVVLFVYLDQVGLPTIGCGHLCREEDFYLHGYTIPQIQNLILQNKKRFPVDNYKVVSCDEVKEMTAITANEIDMLLRKDLLRTERTVFRLINVPLTDNQFAALVSFTFNVGGGALQRSTLRQKLNRGEYSEVPKELNKWVYAGGKRLEGLVARRREEEGLWKETTVCHPCKGSLIR